MKISPNLYGKMDGSKFWCFHWFLAKSLLCVILRYTVYIVEGLVGWVITGADSDWESDGILIRNSLGFLWSPYALSFYRSHKSRPCGFGQSLGRPIVRSISHFFWSTKEKFVQYQIFFVHSLEFFVQSFLKMWFWSVSWPTNCPVNFSFFEKDWTKNSREWTKIPWDWTIFFWLTKKNEK